MGVVTIVREVVPQKRIGTIRMVYDEVDSEVVVVLGALCELGKSRAPDFMKIPGHTHRYLQIVCCSFYFLTQYVVGRYNLNGILVNIKYLQ